MLAVAERALEEPARTADEPERRPPQHAVHKLQRAVGNRTVGRALQRSARGVGPIDPAEVEAERTAAAVLGASGLGPSPRRCACGGLLAGGGECARCRAERLQRREPGGGPAGGAVQPTPAVDRVLAMPGRPLEAGLRAQMEPHVGADFGGVRVHTGPAAGEAARSVGAEAFTSGTDVVFGEGKFAPEATEGRRLLAHELTHVRQQSVGERQIARQPQGGGSWTVEYEDFKKRVFAKATARLQENDAKLDEWRTFINARFDDLDLKAQLTATESEGLIQKAYSGHRIEYLEPYFGARSPATRKFNEAVISHEINGGCQACHESQTVWRWNAEHYREFENLPTTAQLLMQDAEYAAVQRTMRGELPVANYVDSTAFGTPDTLAAPLQFSTPNMMTSAAPAPAPPAPAPLQAPAEFVYPKPNSDLCGPLPVAEEMPTISPSSLGPNTALAVQAISLIHPVLQPLGPQGYRVLPAHIFTDLRDKSPAALRTMVMDKIAARQAGYRWHVQKIADGDEEYYELCPIVDELLPTVSATVQSVVHMEIDLHRAWQAFLEFLQDLMTFLMMVFPPSAFVLAPALGVLQIGTGIEDVKQGSLEKAGIGAGIYSRQVEDAAEARVLGGWMKIVSGSIGVATSGFAITSKMMAKPVPTSLATTPKMGSGLFTPLADGSYMALHPQNQHWVVIQEGSMLRSGPMIDGEFHPMFQAEAPWGNAPPPGTPTWAEYSSGWGGGGGTGAGGAGGGAATWNLSPSRALPAGPGQLLLPAGQEPFGLLAPGPAPGGLLPAGPTPFGLLPAGRTPFLLPSGPRPYGLLRPGPSPFGLLPAGRTPFLLPSGPTPYGLLGPGEPPVPPVPRGPLMLPAGPTPFGLLGPGPMGPAYGPVEPLVIVKIEGAQKGQFWYEGSRRFQRSGGTPTTPPDQKYIVMPLTDAQAFGFRPANTPPTFEITPRTIPGGGLAESTGAGRVTPHPITARTTRQPPTPGATTSTELEAPDIDPSAAHAFPRTITADIAQMQGYNRLLDNGERGILRPGNVSTGGVDAITAEVTGGKAKIYLNDFTSPATPKAATKPTHTAWAGELADATAGNRLNFNDPAVEAAIRQAITDGEVYTRTVRVETKGDRPQPIVTIGQPTKVSP
jgi:hypothetical protein